MGLSVCTIAFNEEQLLGGMLASVREVADELVIGVDDRTTDATAAVVESFGGRVIPLSWSDSFAAARNLTLEAATSEWVLVLDADERLTPIGQHVVAAVIEGELDLRETCGVSFLASQSTVSGETIADPQRTSGRLFRRAECRYWRRVHEEPFLLANPSKTSWTLADGAVGIVHFGASPELWEGRRKHERNQRLLELHLAECPGDTYARHKLEQLAALAIA